MGKSCRTARGSDAKPTKLERTKSPMPRQTGGLGSRRMRWSGCSPNSISAQNIGTEDFGRILAAAEAEAARRHFAGLTCGEVMSRDIVSVAPNTGLGIIADLFRKHNFKTLPVVDADNRLEGIISQNDLIQRSRNLAIPPAGGFADSLRAFLSSDSRTLAARDIMTTRLQTVAPEDGVGMLVQLLSDGEVQAAPVVEDQQLVGIVTRSDLLAVLAQQTVLALAMTRAD